MQAQLDPKIQNRLGIASSELANFCQRWNITEIALFGSVLRNDFTADSDIDFLISFAPTARQGLLTLAQIKRELESLINRPVEIDLKESIEASDNWIRRQEILTTAQRIYDQR